MQGDPREALVQSAVAHQRAGRFTEARRIYEEVLRNDPNQPRVMHYLGWLRHQQGESAAGAELIKRSIALEPNFAMAHNNLGAVYEALGRIEEAMEAYGRAATLDPSFAAPRFNMANLHRIVGRYREAIEGYEAAIRIFPNYTEAYSNLGLALSVSGKRSKAIPVYQKAIELMPDHPGAYNNLASLLWIEGRRGEAFDAIRTAIRLDPNFSEAHNNLATYLKDEGRLDEAIACFRKAVEISPTNVTADSFILYAMLFHPGYDAAAIAEAHRQWDERHGRVNGKLASKPLKRSVAGRKLRIGYVSPEFRDHVVGRNMLPLLTGHDRSQFEIYCYGDVRLVDFLTPVFQKNCDVWRNILGRTNEQFVEMVRADQIDILVDLSLHMAGARLAAFAHRPAPIQVTFAGYPGSTGMKAMAYRLTDPYLDPPDMDWQTTEKAIRLPASFWCYDPAMMTLGPGEAIDVAPLPALANEHITFGCLNNFCKVNDGVLTLWAQVMQAVPNSRMVMLTPEGGRQNVVDIFARYGIDASRIDFVRMRPRSDYLALHAKIDIGLDTFPYNGHTTSLDALWMGVPVVTLVGKTIVGRAGVSQLTNVGLTELIAESKERFVEIAMGLAGDIDRLKALRAGLRERMRKSPLTNARQFSRGIEAAYRQMWEETE